MNTAEWMRRVPISAVGLVLALGLSFFALPSLGLEVFLSPDETAVAVAAKEFARTASFRLQGFGEPDFPWIHPRSFVTNGDAIVPVGFLGMPLLVAGLVKLLGIFLAQFFTPLLALSVTIPLWLATKRWGRAAQFASVVGWLTFPLVILYANRGLFPNLPVVSLAVWATWLTWRAERRWHFALAGCFTGWALLIRPIEAIWILPWVLVAWWENRLQVTGYSRTSSRKGFIIRHSYFVIPVLLFCLLGAVLADQTYGSPFMSGYQLRDPALEAQALASPATRSFTEIWPFGFHPRTLWWNIRAYFFGYLAPWTVLALIAGMLAWNKKELRLGLYVAAWTVLALCLVYGQTLYQDHIRMNQVSLANSFLRYTLPLSVIAAGALGWVVHSLVERFRLTGRVMSVQIVLLIALFGLWSAYSRDDEGVIQNRNELVRYASIRASAEQLLPVDAIVISDRSDKIFFPAFRAVSPLPSPDRIRQLDDETPSPVALFIRTEDEAGLQRWKQQGIELLPMVAAGNETLYIMISRR